MNLLPLFRLGKSKQSDDPYLSSNKTDQTKEETLIIPKIDPPRRVSSTKLSFSKQCRKSVMLTPRTKSYNNLTPPTSRPQQVTIDSNKLDRDLIDLHLRQCAERSLEDPWDPTALVDNLELIQTMERVVKALPKTNQLAFQVENFSMVRMAAEVKQLTYKIGKYFQQDELEDALEGIKSCIKEYQQYFLKINIANIMYPPIELNFSEKDSPILQLVRQEIMNEDVSLERVNLSGAVKKLLFNAADRLTQAAKAFEDDPYLQESLLELQQSVIDLRDAFLEAIGDKGIKQESMWKEVMTNETLTLFGIIPSDKDKILRSIMTL